MDDSKKQTLVPLI